MRHLALLLATVASLLLVSGLAYADINPFTNPGFETGDVTGWTAVPATGYGTRYAALTDYDPYLPAAGKYFLGELATGQQPSRAVFQDVVLQFGDVLQGWAAFGGTDPQVSGAVEVFSGGALVATPWSAVGSGSFDPWTEWSWTAPAAGTYRLSYSLLAPGPDSLGYAFFDAPEGTSVPEPGSCALLLTTLVPLGAWLRRRRRA